MNHESTNAEQSANESSGSPLDERTGEGSEQAPSEQTPSEQAPSEQALNADSSGVASAACIPESAQSETLGVEGMSDASGVAGLKPSRNDGSLTQLDPRWIRLGRTIGIVIVGIVAACTVVTVYRMFHSIAAPKNLIVPVVWALLLIFAVACAWIVPRLRYRHWSYQLGDQVIQVRHGVISRVTLAIPLSRLQHVDIHEGPIARRFGLSSLEIHTAGTRAASQLIPGLSHQTARELRDQLIDAANRGADVVTRD